ncbi:amino acid permease C-terminal domain-containing protein [Nocardia brevicatena]|uniref:amino acid permease C-terminal domain-containing protein n=1 Tax=Nocardia brevicatena TaxID=37327 RepID=UPI0002EBA08D|nr:amino acid permease C-terminal domain-containing protein [Nocardia brevicatena]
MAELTNIGILMAFIVVSVAVIVLRYRRPRAPRWFPLPLMPAVPIVGICFSVHPIWSLPWQTWVRFATWLVLGPAIYFVYSRTHSTPAHTESGGETAVVAGPVRAPGSVRA